jgi:hypothetical protein
MMSTRISKRESPIHPSASNGDSQKFFEVSFVVTPSASETFTPRELSAAYKQFIERATQYLSAESGFRAAADQFGRRVLLVYQESETDVMVFTYPTS